MMRIPRGSESPEPSAGPPREVSAECTERTRSAFLAEASRLLADTLDYEATLVTVAGLALPHLGAWCVVDLLEADGSIRRLAVVHPDASKLAPARDLQLRPPDPTDAVGVPRVLRTGQAEVVAEGMEVVLACDDCDAEHRALLRALGARTFLTVPMVARGRMVGAITFATADRDGSAGEPALAEDLARRCAMAIDNARLYAEAQAARDEAEKRLRESRDIAARAAEVNGQLVLATLREQELTEKAHVASQAKSEFLANMSHEFRTPLNAIVAYADLLDMEIAGPINERQKAHLRQIKNASRHLATLVDDILDLAKVEAGRITVERERASAADAVSASVAMVGAQVAAAGVAIDILPEAPDGAYYLGDEHRVRQILVNLLSNALKFTDPGGRITVTYGSTDTPDPEAELGDAHEWTYIRVEDTGIGIAPEKQAAVFEPFVQVENGLARTRGGTGLGLPIARDLAVCMGGDVTLRSELGKGSRFTLWLPACLPPAPVHRS